MAPPASSHIFTSFPSSDKNAFPNIDLTHRSLSAAAIASDTFTHFPNIFELLIGKKSGKKWSWTEISFEALTQCSCSASFKI
jgi:hypothetical protein